MPLPVVGFYQALVILCPWNADLFTDLNLLLHQAHLNKRASAHSAREFLSYDMVILIL